jgi:hypothetical protein
MSSYLRQGWFETFLPIRIEGTPAFLRIWVEMVALIPLLHQLDELYGSADEPYCHDLTHRRDAEVTLAALLVALVGEQPSALRRASAPAAVAAVLAERYGVRRADLPVVAPTWIDQVDLEPAELALLLPRLFDAKAARALVLGEF